jgi:DNA-binding transcriptional MerR regulator
VEERGWTVGEVARMAGVSVRTLHHYDGIGLLRPACRSVSGYRLYGDDDLERLQRILAYREPEFGLDAIAELLDDPGVEPREHLVRQHRLVTGRLDRLRRLAAALEKELEATTMGIRLTPQERFEVFGDDDPGRYEAQVHQRWGDTDAYRQSQRRVATYGRDDWIRIRAEGEDIETRFAEALRSGLSSLGPEARALAEEHRQHISRWFYDLGYQMHVGLADLYLADERFAAHYDAREPGLARYVSDAVHANAVDRA